MRGDLVIVRAYRNRPLVRRVWDVTPRSVFIIDEENYRRLVMKGNALAPMGFPRRAVFYHDEKLLLAVEKGYEKNPEVWNQLKMYEGRKEKYD